MKTYTNRMKSENVFRAALVVQQNLTSFARTCVNEISSKFQLEVFQVKIIALMVLCKLEDLGWNYVHRFSGTVLLSCGVAIATL